MKLRSLHKILAIVALLLLLFSCASDLDFDQVNNLKIEPVVVTNLAYFEVKANQFVTNGTEQNVFFDAPTIEVFNDSFFKQRLKKVELFFELQNTINRRYAISLVFLDKNNQSVHSTNMIILPSSGIENKVTKTEIFENAELDLLKRTTKIVFTMTMFPGLPLSESSLGSLKMRSGVTAYLVVE